MFDAVRTRLKDGRGVRDTSTPRLREREEGRSGGLEVSGWVGVVSLVKSKYLRRSVRHKHSLPRLGTGRSHNLGPTIFAKIKRSSYPPLV